MLLALKYDMWSSVVVRWSHSVSPTESMLLTTGRIYLQARRRHRGGVNCALVAEPDSISLFLIAFLALDNKKKCLKQFEKLESSPPCTWCRTMPGGLSVPQQEPEGMITHMSDVSKSKYLDVIQTPRCIVILLSTVLICVISGIREFSPLASGKKKMLKVITDELKVI